MTLQEIQYVQRLVQWQAGECIRQQEQQHAGMGVPDEQHHSAVSRSGKAELNDQHGRAERGGGRLQHLHEL